MPITIAYTSKLSPVQTFVHKYTEETDVPCNNGQLTEEINTQFGSAARKCNWNVLCQPRKKKKKIWFIIPYP